MNDLKDIVEKVIKNSNDKYSHNIEIILFYCQNNILDVIMERFFNLYFNYEEENKTIIENKIFKNEIDKIYKKKNKIDITGFINSLLLSICFSIIILCSFFIKDNLYQILFFTSLIALFLTLSRFYISYLKKKKVLKMSMLGNQHFGKIEKKFLEKFKNRVLKIVLEVINDLENMKNDENSNAIDNIKKMLIEETYSFKNNKRSALDRVMTFLTTKIGTLKSNYKENLKNKIIKENNTLKELFVEQKLDFLNHQLIEN